jgi:hypothetical protein
MERHAEESFFKWEKGTASARSLPWQKTPRGDPVDSTCSGRQWAGFVMLKEQ